MIEKGIVAEITEKRIKLDFVDQENCASCGNKLCTIKNKQFYASNVKGLYLEIGDAVNVHVETRGALGASFMVLIVPLILFVLFFWMSGRFLHIEKEGIRALFGIGGLGAGFLTSYLFSKAKRNKLPEIIDKD